MSQSDIQVTADYLREKFASANLPSEAFHYVAQGLHAKHALERDGLNTKQSDATFIQMMFGLAGLDIEIDEIARVGL